MDVIDGLLENNAAYAREMGVVDLPPPPSKELVVVACMDARLDVEDQAADAADVGVGAVRRHGRGALPAAGGAGGDHVPQRAVMV